MMIKLSKKSFAKIVIALLMFLLILIFLFRFLGSREIDDVSPEIFCEKNLIEKSDILWVVPVFENNSIANNKEWCKNILALNKTLGMHGVYHNYNEFEQERDKEYIQIGVRAFESCFGYKPELFKAPQLKLSSENKILLEKEGFIVEGKINQIFSKVYHCSDTGRFSNKFIDLF